jgi:hypothetical protein
MPKPKAFEKKKGAKTGGIRFKMGSKKNHGAGAWGRK